MHDDHGDAAFVLGSDHRVALLQTLREGARTRAALLEETAMSNPTLSRCLRSFEERGWVEVGGARVSLTPLGEYVTASLGSFLASLDRARELRPVAAHLPPGLSPRRLAVADVEVTRPSKPDPQAPLTRAVEQVVETDRIRVLTHGMVPGVAEEVADGVLAGEQTATFVVTGAVVEALMADEALSAKTRRAVEAGLEIYRHDGPIEHVLAVLDDTEWVGVGVVDDEGRPLGTLDVRDPGVHEWAVDTFERHRRTATRLSANELDFTG
jgi:predicted transcriptional regulator